MDARQAIAAQVQLPVPVAAWVLAAHCYATLLPLVLVGAVQAHGAWLESVTDYPALFYVAVGLLCAGSAFEVAQNAIDRWYLTADTGSALAPAFCDFLFYWFITAGQAALALAIGGADARVAALCAALVLAQPLLYLVQRAIFAPLAISGLLVALLGYRAFGDPVIVLQPLMAGLTMYFFSALLRTGAQALHGCTTAAAASGIWFLVWAIGNGAAGTPRSWAFTLALPVAVALLAALAWPWLLRLPATRRAGA